LSVGLRRKDTTNNTPRMKDVFICCVNRPTPDATRDATLLRLARETLLRLSASQART
jgi:hypothetical protein